jgi:hypothetical protein
VEVMKNKKIELRNGKTVTLGELFKTKERFHNELSKLPFEEKIRILMNMQRIVKLKRTA